MKAKSVFGVISAFITCIVLAKYLCRQSKPLAVHVSPAVSVIDPQEVAKSLLLIFM